jgi:hypothetical protein
MRGPYPTPYGTKTPYFNTSVPTKSTSTMMERFELYCNCGKTIMEPRRESHPQLLGAAHGTPGCCIHVPDLVGS